MIATLAQTAVTEGGETRRDTVIQFPEGLPGFEQARSWQLVQHEEAQPFFWLRSVDEPSLALLVVDPRVAVTEYPVIFSRHELARVGLTPTDSKVVLVVVTLRGDGPTVNLRAPLVFNPNRMVGAQIILEDAQWPLRQPLFPGQQ